MHLKSIATMITVGVVVTVGLVACSNTTGAAENTGGQVLKVCTDPGYGPPISYQTPEGAYSGSDPEIARAVAKKLGMSASIQNISFDAFIPAVAQGKCDVYIASVTVTAERAKQVHFTNYMQVGTQLLVGKGNPSGITSLAALSGHAVAVVVGSVGEQLITKANNDLTGDGKPGITLRVFSNGATAAQALIAGQVDAFAQDASGMGSLLQKYGAQVELGLPDAVNKSNEGIVSALSNTALNNALQDAVTALYKDGTIPKILDTAGLSGTALN